MYVFYLFAKRSSDTSYGNYKKIYTSIIDVQVPMSDCALFPLVYEEWSDDYDLLNPVNSPLHCDAIVPFHVSRGCMRTGTEVIKQRV